MSYTYTKHYWEDKPSETTPITTAKLNEIEEGIYQANTNKVDKVSGKQLSTNDFSNQDVTDLAEAKKNSHTHSNKSVLDSITNVKVNNWDNKVDKVPGKGWSENDFTSTLKSNYDNAVTNSHAHSNKTVLDNFSESGGQLLYSGESISGKTEIDDTQSSTDTTYSSSKIEELIEAGGGGGGTPNALTKEVVTELPSYENAKDNVLYLIEDTTTPVPAEGIIDDENVSSTTTYSSQKITDLLDNKVDDNEFTAHTTDTDIHVTADKKTSWDNAVTNSHTHTNKTVLDGITAEKVSKWDNASSSGGGGMSCELLWSNPDVSLEFTFRSSIDIESFDRDKYDLILFTFLSISAKSLSNRYNIYNLAIPIDGSNPDNYSYNGFLQQLLYFDEWRVYSRNISVGKNYIEIDNCHWSVITAAGTTETNFDNKKLIPDKIYGFKL